MKLKNLLKLKTLLLLTLSLLPLSLTASVHAQALLQQQSDTTHGFSVLATDSSGNPLTGLTLTMRVTKQPGTSSVAGTGAFNETDSTNQKGYYFYAPSAADVNTLGDTIFQPTATAGTGFATAVINSRAVDVVAFNPYSATNLGLTALPTVVPGTAGGLPTANSSNQVAVNSSGSTVLLSTSDEATLAALPGYFTALPASLWGYPTRSITGINVYSTTSSGQTAR